VSAPQGLIADVLHSSWVDGPGNRFVVFLQGCDFNCVACHNPYTINACTSCGDCLVVCPTGSLSLVDGVIRWDQRTCEGGDACIAACPIDSTPKAQWTPVSSLMEQVRHARPFVTGVTMSGGEATQQPEFVEAFFTALAADPELRFLSRMVDTNAGASQDVWDRLLPVTDGFLVDLKAFDPEVHQRMTGRPLQPVLDSIRYLAAHDRVAEVRLLIVGGVNDDPATITAAAAWLAEHTPGARVQLTGFRCHGVRPPPFPLGEPARADLEALAELVTAAGLPEPLVV
jgi:YjjW family glycine radical enzyme activase